MILTRRTRGLHLIHSLVQMGLAATLYAVWMALPWDLTVGVAVGAVSNYAAYGFLAVLGLMTCYWRFRGQPFLNLTLPEAIGRSVRQTITVLLFIATYVVIAKDGAISRYFFFSYLVGLFGLLVTTNLLLPAWIGRRFFFNAHQQNTLLLGGLAVAEQLKPWIAEQQRFGIKVVETFSTETDETHAERVLARVRTLATEKRIQQVISLEHPPTLQEFRALVALCEELGLRFLVVSDWQHEVGRRAVVSEDSGHLVMSFFNEPLQCPWNRVLKRSFDLAVAIPAALIVLPPIAVAVWIAHRLQAPGPLFFRQQRTGANGQTFSILKFRTMQVSNGDEAQQASKDDARVFPLGRLLRRCSIDELPQFLNVIAGEMSVIGPRPHLQQHDDVFSKVARWYRSRNLVKPGMTGLAQVRGFRGETRTAGDVTGRSEADLQYLERWSLPMDLAIFARTIWQMIFPPKGAY